MNSSSYNTTILPNVSAEDCSLPVGHGVALIATNSIASIVGTVGNILVCIAVLTNPRLRRPSNYLLVSLAIADLIVTVICEPLVAAIIDKRTFDHDCAAKLEFAYVVSSNLSCTASIANLAAISVDRFLAVVYPLRHGRIMRNYGLKTMLIVAWTLPVVFSSLRIPFLKEKLVAFLALVLFIVCYGVIIVSYALILIFLVKERKRKSDLRARPTVVVTSQVERRVACTLAIVIVIFSACWFPMIIAFFATGKPLVKMHGTAYMWIRTLALTNSAMNFLIYSFRIRDFRDSFSLIFRTVLHCGC